MSRSFPKLRNRGVVPSLSQERTIRDLSASLGIGEPPRPLTEGEARECIDVLVVAERHQKRGHQTERDRLVEQVRRSYR